MKKSRFISQPVNRFLVLLLLIIAGCSAPCKNQDQTLEADQIEINNTLDQFNKSAADADFKKYFNFFTDDAVFIGTDATENWDKKSFMSWAKPHFDKKKTWKFKSIDRHIYFDKTGNIAWFDELLNTQMKICRGSGIMIKQDNDWKIQQYVLSMTIPNERMDTIIKIKAPIEEELIKKMLER